MEREQDILYRKFQQTGQEKIKLACALEGFFKEMDPENAYSKYLKRRIRPAMEALIREEDIEKMEKIEEQGWFGSLELELFICTARKAHKIESLVWLMKLKDSKYGYQEKNFNL